MPDGKVPKADSGDTTPTKEGKGAGRPHIELDTEQLSKLAAMQCTMIEMAAFFGCSVDTLERNYADIIKTAQAKGRSSLRREQYKVAMGPSGKDNPGKATMLIWLGKNLLGQSDRADVNLNQGIAILWDKELDGL